MNFKELLKSNDMTCARLARKLGVSRSLVGFWASGKCKPSLTQIPKLADILSVGIDELVNYFSGNGSL
ncbi:MAG: helix-turn-helix transcriptional regulator [Christensenellales bacterium]|jgi:transcriptional regulator with XRE-family HTH domain|nr:MAG TPA: Helix-turn-helix XRE-family like protein [Caudoviricetes sp.]